MPPTCRAARLGCGRGATPRPGRCASAAAVEVIGAALPAKADGQGDRRIAADLALHAATVRGWIRRVAARAEDIRARCSRTRRQLDPMLDTPAPPSRLLADALEALGAAIAAGHQTTRPQRCAVAAHRDDHRPPAPPYTARPRRLINIPRRCRNLPWTRRHGDQQRQRDHGSSPRRRPVCTDHPVTQSDSSSSSRASLTSRYDDSTEAGSSQVGRLKAQPRMKISTR